MTRVLSVLAAMMLALVAPVAAQPYPDKPIRVIVPFPAGGGGDTLARLVMNKVGEVLGVTIVIDNRAGAGGNIGTEAAARAEPDGYTLAYGTNGTHAINHTLYKRTGFDPLSDFAPISRLTQIALILVVSPGVPAASVSDTRTNVPLAVAIEKGKLEGLRTQRGTTRMVVMGDSTCWANNMLDERANRDFASLAINWLLDRSELLESLAARPIPERRLVMTKSQMLAVQWILFLVMPGSVLLVGTAVWVQRRH